MRLTIIVNALGLLVGYATCQTIQRPSEPVHISTTFQFDVRAPFSRVSLMFGPDSEKAWAGERWQPNFLYPQQPKDIEGTVFTVPHGTHQSIWVNTIYDVKGGRMQYVTIIPNVVATVIDVRLSQRTSSETAVEVTYTRTALNPEANEDVRSLSRHDAEAGPNWKQALEKSLQ
jgi:hypothetical protein